MIEVQSLARRYGAITAVDGVSFSIGRNEVVGLLGHNGAGKTTIMRMLAGYLEPSEGHILVEGMDICRQPRAIQQSLGYLPETLPVYPELSVVDYLDYTATLRGIGDDDRPGKVREALFLCDLAGRALDPIGTLSRGLKQRVGVAQAILGTPSLLILDEPTNGLDPGQTRQMRELIKRLATRTTIILSTHVMQEVEASCDRVLVLRQGRLALDSPLSDLRRSGVMELVTDTAIGPLAAYLERLPQVAALTREAAGEDREVFQLQLRDGAAQDTASNNIAQCVVKAGAKLYTLREKHRDLDTVLDEVLGNAG